MRPAVSEEDRRRRRDAVELLGAHGHGLRRVARRVSLCDDDAEDALQRAVEILLTKAPPIPQRRLAAWMRVVTRREALAVRRDRERILLSSAFELPLGAIDVGDLEASPGPGPGEALERSEWLAEARRALSGLSADQRVALALQACGHSYAEICELCGWTYTKVNRCLAEGRAALQSQRIRREVRPPAPSVASSSPQAP